MGAYVKPRTTRKKSVTKKTRAPQKSRVRKAELAQFMFKAELPKFSDGLHCDSCGRSAKSSTSKSLHQRLHYSNSAPGAEFFKRPYRCDWCGKGFPQKGSLTGHIASQHDKSKMASCINCGERFADRAKLHRHRVREHGHVSKKQRRDDRQQDDELPAEQEEDADADGDWDEDAMGDGDDDTNGDLDAEGEVDDEMGLAEGLPSSSMMSAMGQPGHPANDDFTRFPALPLDFEVADTAPFGYFPAPDTYTLNSTTFPSVDAPNSAAQYQPNTTFSNPFLSGPNNASSPSLYETLKAGEGWTLPHSGMTSSLAVNWNTGMPSFANSSTSTSSFTTPLATPHPPYLRASTELSNTLKLDHTAWDVDLGKPAALGDFDPTVFSGLDMPVLNGLATYTAEANGPLRDGAGYRTASATEDAYAADVGTFEELSSWSQPPPPPARQSYLPHDCETDFADF
ncbi:hypothetical protein K523DRAFT_357419 [Schizophyllum commune Tattone D]|nr:hypothetical protein K523DRAFT_357419 [Schizophyllum commune Tattone D]